MNKEDIKIKKAINKRLVSLGIIDTNCDLIVGGGGAAVWGGITGTLTDQIDLLSALNAKQSTSQKGVANGYAGLDGSGKVPSAQLPSYVDDVLEFGDFSLFPPSGETGKIYIALDTNFVYRWTGSIYVQVNYGNGIYGGDGDVPSDTSATVLFDSGQWGDFVGGLRLDDISYYESSRNNYKTFGLESFDSNTTNTSFIGFDSNEKQTINLVAATTATTSIVTVKPTGVAINVTGGNSGDLIYRLTLNGEGVAAIADNRSTTLGLQYDSDYSIGFDSRSLVDKGYVDSALINYLPNAAGSDTDIQFNNGGLFGASSNLQWNNNTLVVVGKQSINAPANSTAFLLYGHSLSGSNAHGILDLSGTWSTTGNPTAIRLNVTNTGSGASSNLMDLLVGNVSQFKVAKNGALTIASTFTLPTGNFVRFGAESAIGNSSNGVLALYNTAASDFSRLQFGGTTSSFPCLKRSSALLQARLADDSAYTNLEVVDDAYASGWNGSNQVPTKNAVYDKIESLNITSGTYTPTRSAESNLDSNVSMSQAQYMRVGNVVTVSGRFTADPTTPAVSTSFQITLPIASNIGAAEDIAGVSFCSAIAGMGAAIFGVSANDTAIIQWVAADTTSQTWSYTFTYEVI